MLLKATKFFFFLFILYTIYTIVLFIMALPDFWGAFQILLDKAPIPIAFLIIYLVLNDIISEFYKVYADTKSLKLKIETQNKELKKELTELKAQLKNKEN